jgi:phosphatidylinositol phospholipase C delta
MTRPMSEYWIKSSHNTNLTGHQLTGLSNMEMHSNIQTTDEAILINDGRFRETGGVSYVLKPSILMVKEEHEPHTMHLEIKILSGSCLPKPKGLSRGECIDPYVKISLFDCHEGKEVNSSQTTETLFKNGFSPIWNFETSYQLDVKNTCVAVIKFLMWNKNSLLKDGKIIASASVPISCMRQGIRSVQLFNKNMTRSGAFEFASLLVVVKFEHSQCPIPFRKIETVVVVDNLIELMS